MEKPTGKITVSRLHLLNIGRFARKSCLSKALLKGAPKLEMRNKFLYLFTVFMYSIVVASNSKSEFNGTLSILGPNTESNSRTLGLNLRYIPLVKFDISSLCDAEVSGNIFTTFDSNNIVDVTNKLEIKPYRVWLRFGTTKFEARIGLQKINFGPARILRSLMWFDQIDPRDPLQFTSGVYGLRMRYDFQNNTNISLWGLYGNKNPKGWEVFGTKDQTPEIGGRIQYPIGNSELAVSGHYRDIRQEGISENRIALDGFWDVGIGLWFESVIAHISFEDSNRIDYHSFLTLGTDYTFGIGNGITATLEHLLRSIGNRTFSANERYNTSAISLSYPVGIMDALSLFSYYDWNSEMLFNFLTWQRTYDYWTIQFSGYWINIDNMRPMNSRLVRTVESQGFQFMTIFNY